MLVLTLKMDGEVQVGDTIIKLVQIKGKQIRLAFDGPAKIDRLFKKALEPQQETTIQSEVSTQQPLVAARARES